MERYSPVHTSSQGYRKKMRPALRALSILLLACCTILVQPNLARAGIAIAKEASLNNLDLSGFPQVTAYIDVRDGQGEFVRDLQPNMVRVLEDDLPIQAQSFEDLNPGAMFVMALNPGRIFSIRDGQGRTRYDGLQEALNTWISVHDASNKDDLSLLVTDGPEAIHQEDGKQWLAALQSAGTDFRSAKPSLDVLMRAVELAEERPPRPGMGKAILFVTSLPEGDYSAGLQGLIRRAIEDKIRIFVWLIASTDQFQSPGAAQLRDLAEGTGGNIFLYSGIEQIPDIEGILSPLRRAYRLVYPSKITTSGSHKLVVQVRMDGTFNGDPPDAVTPTLSFDMVVKPPNPMFVSLPKEILRESQRADLTPAPEKQVLDLLVEFPDGYIRPLSKIILYVDGAPVAVLKDPPFTQITWDLRNYIADGTHRVRLEAIDSLGLQSSSIEIPVKLIVKLPPESIWSIVSKRAPLIAGIVILFSVTAVALALIFGGRVRPKGHVMGNGKAEQKRSEQKRLRSREKPGPEQLTQPVGKQEIKEPTIPRVLPAWMSPLQLSQRRLASHSHAFLVHLRDGEGEGITIPAPIQIATNDVTLGSDHDRAAVVLDDPSIEPIHSRLSRSNARYRISDEGTIAGTWVNYTPVSKEGIVLEHGDLVHIGRLGFRFLIRNPSRTRKPVVTPEDLTT